jgi:TRAP transporter TAXI family solute receptor
MKVFGLKHVATLAVAGFMAASAATASAEEASLPKSMVWTSYDLGTAGYAEASAIADALDKKYNTRVRIVPSGTAVGRMLPLQTGRATFGFMSTEVHFATEAMFEFAALEWGPQDMRVVIGRPAAVGLVVGGDVGFDSIYDVKGAKVGFVQANPSTTVNTGAALAFAGLTPDDVEKVVYPSYGALTKGFISGEIDVAPAIPTSSFLREAEGGRGVKWLNLDKDDKEGWARVANNSSMFSPYLTTVGVALSEESPAYLLGYRYPQLSVRADADADEVYNMIKALDDSYDLYKDATKVINLWELEIAGKPPAGAPFHEGAVKYLKEKGIWTDEHEAWNQARIARIAKVKDAWDTAVAKAEDEGISGKKWPAFWAEYRAQHLD